MKKLFILASILILFGIFTVSAQNCQVTVSSDNTIGFLKEISTLDQALTSCPTAIPSPMSMLVGSEKVQMNILMEKGTTEIVIAEITNDYLTGLAWGGTGNGWLLTTDECTMDTILREKGIGTYAYAYNQGKLKIQGQSLGKRIMLIVFRPFLNSAANKLQTPVTIECTNSNSNSNNFGGQWGKPDNCDETWLPGHRNYAENKELWDSYSLDSDGVCQSQYGRGTPSPCVHAVQLSIEGNPYYLCWYKN